MSDALPDAVDVLFAGGGSGGHLFPGLAVATALAQLRPDWRLHFAGSDRDVERRIMQGQPWPHTPLPVMSPAQMLRRPVSFLSSNWRAWRTVRQFWRTTAPKMVIGLGGFASVPALWVAARKRTPIILLEQNAIPGRATRWFVKMAAAVCLGFEETSAEMPSAKNLITTGNPLRDEIAALFSSTPLSNEKRLLVLGGSQGACGLNQAMMAWAAAHPEDLSGWQIVHQSGPHSVTELRQAYRSAGLSARVEEFVRDMATEYRAATIVISRAGATTLSELACAGRPAILVPFPQAADDHQRRNAHWFMKAGAAICVEQQASPSQTAAELSRQWSTVVMNPDRLTTMSQAMRQRAHPDAAERVARLILDIVSGDAT